MNLQTTMIAEQFLLWYVYFPKREEKWKVMVKHLLITYNVAQPHLNE